MANPQRCSPRLSRASKASSRAMSALSSWLATLADAVGLALVFAPPFLPPPLVAMPSLRCSDVICTFVEM